MQYNYCFITRIILEGIPILIYTWGRTRGDKSGRTGDTIWILLWCEWEPIRTMQQWTGSLSTSQFYQHLSIIILIQLRNWLPLAPTAFKEDWNGVRSCRVAASSSQSLNNSANRGPKKPSLKPQLAAWNPGGMHCPGQQERQGLEPSKVSK